MFQNSAQDSGGDRQHPSSPGAIWSCLSQSSPRLPLSEPMSHLALGPVGWPAKGQGVASGGQRLPLPPPPPPAPSGWAPSRRTSPPWPGGGGKIDAERRASRLPAAAISSRGSLISTSDVIKGSAVSRRDLGQSEQT